MKVIISSFFLFVFLSGFAQSTQVVVVGIDGLNNYRFDEVSTPNFDYLKANGAWTMMAQANMPTSSSPNWASIMRGTTPEVHQMKGNGFDKDVYRNNPTCASEPDYFPTIFTLMNEQKPDEKIGLFYQWLHLKRLVVEDKFNKKNWGFLKAERNVIKGMKFYKKKDAALTFMHLDHCDHAGHEYGHESAEYLEALTRADDILGDIIATIEEKDGFENTVLIVVTDHGGIATGHGGDTPQEINVPWFVIGKGIKKGHEIAEQVKVEDSALMMARLLGVEAHECWTGKVIEEVFE